MEKYQRDIARLDKNTKKAEEDVAKAHNLKGKSVESDVLSLDFATYIDMSLVTDEETPIVMSDKSTVVDYQGEVISDAGDNDGIISKEMGDDD